MRSKFIFLTICLTLLMSSQSFAKIRILTFHYNHPEFIVLQHRTYSKFFENEYELIVFNDARDPKEEEGIRKTCEQCGLQCIRFEQAWHLTSRLNEEFSKISQDPSMSYSWIGGLLPEDFDKQPSLRHSHVVQYALDNFGYNHDDIVVIADADIFPIRPFNLRDWIRRYDILGLKRVKQNGNTHIEYLWPVFVAFRPKELPNLDDFRFSVDLINGVIDDTGSHTYHYLRRNPQVCVYMCTGYLNGAFTNQSSNKIKKYGFNDREIDLIHALPKNLHSQIEFHLSQHFLHFSGFTFNYDGHDEKFECMKNFLEKILASE